MLFFKVHFYIWLIGIVTLKKENALIRIFYRKRMLKRGNYVITLQVIT